MKNQVVFVCLGLVMWLSSGVLNAQNAAELYANSCSGCHGEKMQGSAAGSALIKKDWKHGGDRKSIIASISKGVEGTNMISWSGALSEKEIAALADYILKAQASPNIVKPVEKPRVVETKLYTLNVEKIVSAGLDAPWGFEFVDANKILVTGKNGDLYWVVNRKLDPKKITGLPKLYAYDMFGGLMDIAIDPDYSKTGWVYLGFSHTSTGTTDRMAPGMTKIVRGKIRDHQWTDEQTLFQVDDSVAVTGGMRWGCRLMFDKAGYLYFTIGDMQQAIQSGNNPQLPHRAEGKIYRINRDGTIPQDNPYYGRKDALQAIYAWGTRNVQGLAQHPVTGEIFFSDHGPQGGDELNVLKKGGNYGWPVITYGVNYDGTTITKETHKEGMEQPITYWTPSIAVCAVEFAGGKLFPKWQDNLFVTALKFEELRRIVLKGNEVVEQEILLKGYGRVRDVKTAPDGSVYVLTNSPDGLLRITPKIK